MKVISLITLIFLSTTLFAQPPSITIQHWTLTNKTQVFFVQRTELPMLDVELVFSAGSARDDDHPGLSILVNRMMSEGADHLSATELAEKFDNVGAQFLSFSGRDMSAFVLRTTTKPAHLNAALDNFAWVIAKPTFSTTALTRVKQQILSEIKSQDQDPVMIASNQFYTLIYQDNFYAHNPLGNAASVDAITQKQLIAFYKKYYTGSNANLILVGDISEDQAKTISEKIAGELPVGESVDNLSDAKDVQQPILNNISFSSQQSTLMIGQVGVSRQHPDYYALMVGNAIFGGMPSSSILYNEIREKRGLAYDVSSVFHPLEYRGPFYIFLQTSSDQVDQTNELVKKLLKKFIHEGPTTTQLNTAKKNLISGFSLWLSSNQSILAAVTNVAFYHRPLNYFNEYEKNIDAVTVEDVKNAFQKNINTDKLVTVVVGK